MGLYPTTRVTRRHLRALFAELYEGRIESGEMREEVVYREPAPPEARQPAGTMSELVEFFDGDGRKVARAHRYATPSGGLGGSGLLDPQAILHEGRIYRV
jgi:hypothetical protein